VTPAATAPRNYSTCENRYLCPHLGTLGGNDHLSTIGILEAACSGPKATKTQPVEKSAARKKTIIQIWCIRTRTSAASRSTGHGGFRSIHNYAVSQKDKLPLRYGCGIFYNRQVPLITGMTLQYHSSHKNNIKERVRPPNDMPMQTQRGGGSIVPSHSQPDIGRRRMVITTPRTLYAPKRPDTHCTRHWVSPGAAQDGMENLNPVEIRSPDRPAINNSLYRLRHPSRQFSHRTLVKCVVQCASDKQTISVRRTESREGKDLGGICEDVTP
jgi:hypothetical protein